MTITDNLIINDVLTKKFKNTDKRIFKVIHKRMKNISYEKTKNTFEYENKFYKSERFRNCIMQKYENNVNTTNNHIRMKNASNAIKDTKYSGVTIFNIKKEDIESLQIIIGSQNVYYAKYNILDKMNFIKTVGTNVVITFPFTVIIPKISYQEYELVIKTKKIKFSYKLNECSNQISFVDNPLTINYMSNDILYQKFTDYSMVKCINNIDEYFFRTSREIFIIPVTNTNIIINEKHFYSNKSFEKMSLGFYEGYVNIKVKGYVFIYYEFDNHYAYSKSTGLSGITQISDNHYLDNNDNYKNKYLLFKNIKINKINKKIKITKNYIYTNDVKYLKLHEATFIKNKSGYLCKIKRTDKGFTFVNDKKSYYIDKNSILITQFGNCGSRGTVKYTTTGQTGQTVSIGSNPKKRKITEDTDKHDDDDDDEVPEHPTHSSKQTKYDDDFTDGFYGYKACKINNVNIIVKLFIKNKHSVAKALHETKMRTEEAYVVDAWKIINNESIKCDKDDVICSIYDSSFKYIIGNSVRPTNGYTHSLDKVCVPGIHFFMSPKLAFNYAGQNMPTTINFD